MVFYSHIARQDLKSIFDGLLTWSKHQLEYNHVVLYHNTIIDVCDSLDKKAIHFNARYIIHKRYGEKVHTYKRNKQCGILSIILTSTTTYTFNEFYPIIPQ